MLQKVEVRAGFPTSVNFIPSQGAASRVWLEETTCVGGRVAVWNMAGCRGRGKGTELVENSQDVVQNGSFYKMRFF